jgi:hypothetical protein
MRLKPHLAAALLLLCGCATVDTQVEINAPAKAVRAVLFGFDDYPKWNPFITKVDGLVAEGSSVYVTLKPFGMRELNGDVIVTTVNENQLSWKGTALAQMSGSFTLPVPGILSGEHDFIIQELGPDRTLFLNNDKISGTLLAFNDLQPMRAALEAMNEALKKRAEENSK